MVDNGNGAGTGEVAADAVDDRRLCPAPHARLDVRPILVGDYLVSWSSGLPVFWLAGRASAGRAHSISPEARASSGAPSSSAPNRASASGQVPKPSSSGMIELARAFNAAAESIVHVNSER